MMTMSNCPFCNTGPSEANAPIEQREPTERREPPNTVFRRPRKGGQLFVPGTILALMPKCPICVAAYIALFSGLGVSVGVATWIRDESIVMCVSALMYLSI